MAQKVVQSVDNITIRPCETLQPTVAFVQELAKTSEYKAGINGYVFGSLSKSINTDKLLATILTLMVYLLMYP